MSDADHAPLAPSGASCWLYCTASVEAQKGIPDRSTREADEGTAMHEVRARCLKTGAQPMDFLGHTIFAGTRRGTLATRERLKHLEEGIDQLRTLCGDDMHLAALREPTHYRVEETLHFRDPKLADVYGTLDFGAYVHERETGLNHYVQSDLKFGAGTPVYAEGHEQQLIYAGLSLDQFTQEEKDALASVVLIIDQPRISGAGGAWVIDVNYVETWMKEVLYPAVAEIKSGRTKFAPSRKACLWCRARPTCAAYQDFNVRALGITFEDERDPIKFSGAAAVALTPEERAYLALNRGMFEKFLEVVSDLVLQDALAGNPTPGLKAINGNNGKRTWVNDELAEAALWEHLGKKAVETKVISPTAAADLLPRTVMDTFKDLIRRDPPKPKLVPVENSKPALTPVKMEDERITANG